MGVIVAAVVTWTKSSNARVRLRLLEVLDDGSVNVEVLPAGEERRVLPGQVKRYWRADGEWKRGDFVVKIDVPEDEWRGVVVEMADLEVLVQTPEGTELVFADEVESAWARDPELPPLKRGPIASDPVVERVGNEVAERRRAFAGPLPGEDADGYAL